MDLHANALIAAILCVTGCTTATTTSATGGDGGAPTDGATAGGDGGAAGASGALTCGAILDCLGACASSDAACPDACVAKGSPPAKDAVTKLATCSNTNACADAPCLQSKCSAELQACVASASTGGTPLDSGVAPAGNVPAELVGKWYSYGVLFEFGADGSASRSTNVSTGGCTSTSLEKGTAVVAGTTLTTYFTSGIIKLCGSSSGDPYQPTTTSYTYRVETVDVGIVLRLSKQNCQYTDQASIDFYCTDGYDKK